MSAQVICLGCAAIDARPECAIADRYAWALQCSCGATKPLQLAQLRARLYASAEQAGRS
nr:hypothetical protein [Polyangiaceae bacterium]